MSKYTTQIRMLCQTKANTVDNNPSIDSRESLSYSNPDACIDIAAPLIFDFPYPIFDGADNQRTSYKVKLEHKILRHYYTREISEETVGLWKLRLNAKLNEIMPYYNQLYLNTFERYGISNPFIDVDLSETNTATKHTTDRNESTGTSQTSDVQNSRGGYSDTTNASSNAQNTNVETTSGSYSDTQSGNETKDFSGSYTDDHDNTRKYSDTPQGSITSLTDGYLTNVTIDDGKNKRSYSNNLDVSGYREKTTYNNAKTKREYDDYSTSNTNNSSTSENAKTTRDYDSTNTSSKNNLTNNLITKNGDIDENAVKRIIGKRTNISYSKLLKDLRETFINVDMMIIDELSNLFFGLWE